MVHMAKFHQNRLKDLGARRVDDRQTHRHTDKQTQAKKGQSFGSGQQTNAGNNKGNPSDWAKNRKMLFHWPQIIALKFVILIDCTDP